MDAVLFGLDLRGHEERADGAADVVGVGVGEGGDDALEEVGACLGFVW